MSKKKVYYPKIGTMIEKRDKETGEPILDANDNKTYYIKIDKDADIRINGKKVTSEYLNVGRPRDKYDRMKEKGTIDAKEHEEKVSRYEGEGDLSFAKFEISATTED